MWDIPKTIEAVTNVVGKFVPDTNQRAQIEFELQKLALQQQQEQLTAQIEVNKVEASHPNWFISGWRPAVGWTCVWGLNWAFWIGPVFYDILKANNIQIEMRPVPTEILFQLLLGLLGIGAMRTIEKIKGVASK